MAGQPGKKPFAVLTKNPLRAKLVVRKLGYANTLGKRRFL